MIMPYDALAQEYALHRRIHPGVLPALLKGSRITSRSRILEVGCGTGNYILAIQAAAGCTCQGIDPSGEMLDVARSRSASICFTTGRAENLDFDPEVFDLVFSVDVIHHICDRKVYFQQAQRVMKPGGRICTVTDSEQIIRNRRPLSNYFPETVPMELKRYPSIADIHEMMSEAGLVNISQENVEYQYATNDIQAYRDKAYSSLHLLPREAFERGMQRLEADLTAGPIQVASRYVLIWGTRR